MTHPLMLEVRAALEKAGDPAKAPKMQAYMKSAMPYRGVSSLEQKAIWKGVFPAHPLSSRNEWQRVALTLWREAAFREERYAADCPDRPARSTRHTARSRRCRCSRR